jgi:hypothetical protein
VGGENKVIIVILELLDNAFEVCFKILAQHFVIYIFVRENLKFLRFGLGLLYAFLLQGFMPC